MRAKRIPWGRPSVATALLVSACSFEVSDRVINDPIDAGQDAGSSELDAGAENAGAVDLSEQRDDASPNLTRDAELDATVDSEDGARPCNDASCSTPCVRDAECRSDAYCSRVTQRCVARCERALCAGPEGIGGLSSLISDDQQVFWSTTSHLDIAGNPLNDGAIWRWDLSAAPVKLTTGLGQPELLSAGAGYVYLYPAAPTFTGRTLQRLPIAPSAVPEIVVENILRAWTTSAFVYWGSLRNEVEEYDLWRAPLTAPRQAQHLVTTVDQSWLAGDDGSAVASGAGTRSFGLVEPITWRELAFIDWRTTPQLIVKGSRVIVSRVTAGSADVARLDINAPGDTKSIAPAVKSDVPIQIVERDGWIYWRANERFGRTQIDLQVLPAELLNLPILPGGTSKDRVFTVIGRQLVFYDEHEQRLFVFDLPPLPCSASLACPSNQRCSDNMMCEAAAPQP